ncbi:MAG: homoserine kinase [Thermoanaerobaculia bacterium]
MSGSDSTGGEAVWVRAAAPASVSNVCCGFDLLGFAIAGWQDVVEARRSPEPGVRLLEVSGDDGRLPRNPEENTAGVAVAKLLELLGWTGGGAPGVELRLHKVLPLASGLGSSGASAVAALVATDEALGLGADEARLLAAAMEGERVACGAAHPDNVAPTLHGGLLLVRPGEAPGEPPELTELPVPDGLTCVLLHPHSEVATQAARAVLPVEVPVSTLTAQAGNLAALVTGLFRGDDGLISAALVDLVAEPVRADMTPGFAGVRRAALAAGALGGGLSGSGPTMFAWTREPEQAERVAEAMRRALERDTGLDGDLLISPVGARGARVVADGEPL